MFRRSSNSRRHRLTLLACLPMVLAGCNKGDMHEQPRYDPLEPSVLFEDGRSARPLVEGTVARGHLRTDHHFFEGRVDGELVATFPEPVTAETFRRGRERYQIFCTPCHGGVGVGDGMAVQRGYPRPPTFHSERLRSQPVGHFYDVITNGYGRMLGYAAQVPPADRWAIIAYIRALQTSQNASRDQLTQADVNLLEEAGSPDQEFDSTQTIN